jgi:fluoroquinolone resistance protein
VNQAPQVVDQHVSGED